jgi:hypothetical protein
MGNLFGMIRMSAWAHERNQESGILLPGYLYSARGVYHCVPTTLIR